jgi:DNA-binding winged helix-turn-helix (wHTH) protein
MGRDVKVIRIRRGFLGFGERRKQQRAIARMTRRGYRYVDTVKKWGGYDLTFIRDD